MGSVYFVPETGTQKAIKKPLKGNQSVIKSIQEQQAAA